jgi:hypothetical protein
MHATQCTATNGVVDLRASSNLPAYIIQVTLNIVMARLKLKIAMPRQSQMYLARVDSSRIADGGAVDGAKGDGAAEPQVQQNAAAPSNSEPQRCQSTVFPPAIRLPKN